MSERTWPLTDEQRPAVDPGEVVWLSASAGTGKTQVLSARVLRLLLQPDVAPSQVLCLTFTKAGATEMAARINATLARWVRLPDAALATELNHIGGDVGERTLERARTRFAAVLDCLGGGLRIDTIHAFAQWLLAAFPAEAGLSPGVRAMEDRDRDLLLREVLSQLLVDAERSNDVATLDALASLSVRSGPDEVERFLLRCASAREAWEGPGGWQPPMLPRVRALIGLPSDASRADLATMCGDAAFAVDALGLCLSAYSQWNGIKGQAGRIVIREWLASDPDERAARLPELHKVLFTLKDTVRDTSSLSKCEEHFAEAAETVLECSLAVRERRVLLELAAWLAPALELGRKFSLAWDEAKARAGFIDFDDQIRVAAALLHQSELAEWIRYKLDRRFDHILVDEAQDTNAAQWRIIEALTGEFFAGEGAQGDRLRTLFVVGDYKQAIFRFQGTSPENFRRQMERVRREMEGAAENARSLRANQRLRSLKELGLGTSFRTAQPILTFVDRAIAAIGPENFGLTEPPKPHVGEDRPGAVTLWNVVGSPEVTVSDDEEGDEGWLARSDRRLADRIAQQVRAWLDQGFPLAKGAHRNAGPGDVMILVRKRKELAGLIVARLHAAGVPVAGVDRLRLAAPLGVRDLIAALRFAVQPLDDLNFACLLVSPLIGWSQDDLLAHAYRPEGMRLWEHLRASREAAVVATMADLLDLLRRADFEPPQALLHWVLAGPWAGRRKLIVRLGREVEDPVDELLNAASAFAANETPSLQGFLRWFDAGEGELKREAGKSDGLVRVMTVHGAKGLQAPIVILADAADNPETSRPSATVLGDPADEARQIPLPSLRKEEKLGRIAAAEAQTKLEERQEHWRLLYVAMTRAEEALFVAGALGPREKAPADDSWYARIGGLLDEAEELDDPIWGARREIGSSPPPAPKGQNEADPEIALPDWLTRSVTAEPRPPRPLAPSSLGEDKSADPPSGPGLALAARRGVLLHRLLERLPAVAAGDRERAALAWLELSAPDFAADHAEIIRAALTVIAEPEWAELFGPAALAEVPIAAVVGGLVVAGTIDRLLVTPGKVRLVDFKTARHPPAAIEAIPPAILRQMAAYVAALEIAYPDRAVEAAVLYTAIPALFTIPPELIAAHKPALALGEQSY